MRAGEKKKAIKAITRGTIEVTSIPTFRGERRADRQRGLR